MEIKFSSTCVQFDLIRLDLFHRKIVSLTLLKCHFHFIKGQDIWQQLKILGGKCPFWAAPIWAYSTLTYALITVAQSISKSGTYIKIFKDCSKWRRRHLNKRTWTWKLSMLLFIATKSLTQISQRPLSKPPLTSVSC